MNFPWESNPQFQAMNYPEQQQVRAQLLPQYLQANPQFQAIPDAQKPQVVAQLINGPPAFQHPEMTQYVDQTMQQFDSFQSSPQAQQQQALGVVNPVGKMRSFIDSQAMNQQSLMVQLINHARFGIENTLGIKEPFPGTAPVTYDLMYGADAAKAKQFFQAQLDQTGAGAQTKMFQGSAQFFGMVLDSLPLGLAGGVGGALTKAALVSKTLDTTARTIWNTTRFGQAVARVVAPEAVNAAIGGVGGVIQDQIKSAQAVDRGEAQKTLFQSGAGAVAAQFGINAGINFALGIATQAVLPFIGRALKSTFTKKGAPSSVLNQQVETPEQLAQLLDSVTSAVPNSSIDAQLNPVTQDVLSMRQELAQILVNDPKLENLDDYGKTLVQATNQAMVLRQTSDGYRLRTSFPGSSSAQDSIIESPDLFVIRRAIVDKTLTNLPDMPPMLRNQDNAGPEWLKNQQLAIQKFDATFDPSKVSSLTPAEMKAAKIKLKSFTPVSDRPYISVDEANQITALSNSPELYAARHSVPDVTPTSTVQSRAVLNIGPSDPNGNAFVTLRNVAPAPEVQAAQQMVKPNTLIAPQAQVNITLAAKGYDGYVLPGNQGVVSFYPDNIRAVVPEVNADGLITRLDPTLKVATSPITVAQNFSAQLGNRQLASTPNAIIAGLSRFKGPVNPHEFSTFASNIIEGTGQKATDYTFVSGAKFGFDPTSKTFTIPVIVPDSQSFATMVHDFGSALNTIRKTGIQGQTAKQLTQAAIDKGLVQTQVRFTPPISSTIDQANWISDVANRNLGSKVDAMPGGGYRLTEPNGNQVLFSNVNDLTDSVMGKLTSVQDATIAYKKQGFKLLADQKTPDQFLLTDTKGTKVASGSLNDISQAVAWKPEKLDWRFGPIATDITPGSTTFHFNNSVISGPRSSILSVMNRYTDYAAERARTTFFATKDATISIGATPSDIRVEAPHLGFAQQFASLKDARQFVSGGWRKLAVLKDIAESKGLRLDIENGRYSVMADDGVYSAKNINELGQIFQKYPDPIDAPEIFTAYDPQTMKQVSDMLKQLDIQPAPPVVHPRFTIEPMKLVAEPVSAADVIPTLTPYQTLSYYWKSGRGWFQKVLKQTGHPELLKSFQHMEVGQDISTSETNRLLRAFDQLLRASNGGELPNIELQKKLFYHLGAQGEGEMAAVLEQFGHLTAQETQIANNIRQFYDRLAVRFGIDGNKFVFNYMPRIISWAKKVENKELVKKLFNTATPEELFDEVFGKNSKVSTELKAFFEHQRTSDILTFAPDDNLMRITGKYLTQGNRKLHLAEPWRDIANYMNTHEVPQTLRDHFVEYRDLALGQYNDKLGRQLNKLPGEFLLQLKKKFPNSKLASIPDVELLDTGSNLQNTLLSLNYMTNMAFRPYNAVRNSMQIFSTAAPMVDNYYVIKALKWLSKAPDSYMQNLYHIGILQDRPPIVNDIVNQGKFGRLVEHSMRWFKNADEYTRAVTYRAAEMKFEDQVAKYTKGIIDANEFARLAGLTRLKDNVKEQAMQLLLKKDTESINAAKAIFASTMEHDTMFVYRASNSPGYAHSTIGKFFGQYGTYSAGFREMVWNGFQTGTMADKLHFAGTLAINHATMWAVLTGLGVKASNILPWNQMSFGGGPYFNTFTQLLNLTNSGASKESVIKQASGMLLRLVPGSLHYYYLQQAIKHLEHGDLWKMMLSLTTAPTTPDQ